MSSESENTDSTSDDEIVLHKPVFLKKKRLNIKSNEPNVTHPDNITIEEKISEAHKHMEKQKILANTNNVPKIVHLLIQLEEKEESDLKKDEHCLWLERKAKRWGIKKQQLIKEQMEIESKEENRLKNSYYYNKDDFMIGHEL
ncbi:U4/U6-U5 snRNP complex subunit SPP381 SCDLUD_005116 [Saccharomycodes ludwigii]|uniref:U4/U6-U5 snRNP complex subunit SPP381 n=1 Tax=Saccharomycodes ludwigii TaxID=36035 RepID=UPI001E8610A6|nr:hypothetical protein SCDLUD_005116 [Saccharomycodes ludwigii]KAH3898781.1 hypothetical protein SCDLUD_005116 [Saccharomycodes ludwigii]